MRFLLGMDALCLVDLLLVRLFGFVCVLLLVLACCGWFVDFCLLVLVVILLFAMRVVCLACVLLFVV